MNNGKVSDYTETWDHVEAKLYDFGINSDRLDQTHKNFLDEQVVPILASGGSVSLAGEASRTGSSCYNGGLSLRRAQSVLIYLRMAVERSLRYRDATNDIVASPGGIGGVGEMAAIKANQPDNTEDAFYRAVRVSAWTKPIPPPTPQPPKITPVKKVKRVIKRSYTVVNTRSPGGNPIEDGSAGEAIAGLIRGIDVKREYHMYSPEFFVTKVIDKYAIDDRLFTGHVSTTSYDSEIRYEWGPYKEWVSLTRITIHIHKGEDGPGKPKTTTHLYKRNRLWKIVSAPNAK